MVFDEAPSSFLDVKHSLGGQQWVERLNGAAKNTALAISQQLDIPEIVARVIAGRGIALEEAKQFLSPSLRELMPDPNVLTDMDKATTRLVEAIKTKQKVAIFGDYDVDGACSSALMSKFLNHHGVPNEIYIPDRIFEGYGPNPDAIKHLIDNGAKLIITVDCGATSFEALEEAAKLKTDVVVLDHHQMSTEMPPCTALVNPNRQDDLSGLGIMCAAGVVFMTLVSTARALRQQGYYNDNLKPPDLLQWLDLVALATVCDVMPLQGLNRAFVVKGLQVMQLQQNVGLRELMRVGRLNGPPNTYHLGFVLGPRINAGGRIGDAALGSRLLTLEDEDQAREIAQQLDEFNVQRQALEKQMLEVAIAEAEAEAELSGSAEPAVLVTSNDDWHPGVVGLLASRLKSRFNRPAVAIAFDKSGKGSGSARSITGVDLGEAVRAANAQGILDKGGGHAMAAGLTVQKEKLGALRAYLEEHLSEDVHKMRQSQRLKIDGALSARGANLALFEMLEKAGPFGQGHSQPIFAFPAHTIANPRIVGAGHVSFTAVSSDGAKLGAIAFGVGDSELGNFLLNSGGKQVHLAGTLNADFWQGSRRMQLRLLDAALAA